MKQPKWWHKLLLAFAVVSVILVFLAWKSFGQHSSSEILQRSAQFKDGHFENYSELKNSATGMLSGMLHASENASPKTPLSTLITDLEKLKTAPESGLRFTWLGHSTVLIEIDPVFSTRISPLSFVGPTRWYAPMLPLADVPLLDAVLISHDHYDHLDMESVIALEPKTKKFIVPLGVGGHLRYWGIPADKVIETDWSDETKVNDINIVTTPARHASGRHVFDKDATLWASYSILGTGHRVFFSGDTGLFPQMKNIGEKYGPFDATLIEVGQYHSSWPDWHIGPEQAVTAHTWLRGGTMIPIHWGLLTLAYHGWTEPIERVKIESEKQHVKAVFPKAGQSFELLEEPKEVWWPALPFDSAEAHAIVSTW
jgi:L-ascorbate metabolism protein UlaG (beta-lactamase superfamily)